MPTNTATLELNDQLLLAGSTVKATLQTDANAIYVHQLNGQIILVQELRAENAAFRAEIDRLTVEIEKLKAAQPAAHGDEAVRKPELAGYFSFCEDKQKWLQQKSKGAEFNHLFTPLYAMRAQGDGEVQ